MPRKIQHKTTHAAQADKDGKVLVLCERCPWRDTVDVSGLSYTEALTAIYKARDEHEANPDAAGQAKERRSD